MDNLWITVKIQPNVDNLWITPGPKTKLWITPDTEAELWITLCIDTCVCADVRPYEINTV